MVVASSTRARRAASALAIATSFVAFDASAGDENGERACVDTYTQSQVLLKSGGLLPARAMLLTCVQSRCSDWMTADCEKWLGQVEARIPTIVFAAKNTAGRDLSDVRVTRGADVVSARLDGRALDFEPGRHTFVFTTAKGERRETEVVVREGAKAQVVSVIFDAPPGELASAGDRRPAAPTERATSPLRLVGIGLAAAGAVGLGVGTVFGVRSVTKKSDAQCDGAGQCESGAALDDAKSAADVATVGFVAGGVLLATGLALVIFAPPGRVRATTAMTPRGGLLQMTW